jgi:hypothetical protein
VSSLKHGTVTLRAGFNCFKWSLSTVSLTIEYRVWDGAKIIVDKSKNNLEGLRNFFKDIGDYVEHSQLIT